MAGTITATPNGAPLYGPVRYALPPTTNGLGPGPVAVVTVPSWEEDGQDGLAFSAAPELAAAAATWASEHSATAAILPSRPVGRETVRPAGASSESLREKDRVNGEKAPAWLLRVPA
jgi:hypothetical protein